MIDNSKRYQKTRKGDPKHLGNYVQFHVEKNKIKKSYVSTFLGILPTTFNQYFKQPSFQFNILWRISLAVKHNFLMELGEQLNIPYETKAEKALKVQLLEKEEYIKSLETQLKVYKGIHKVTD
ncbi:transcriptional regulator [Flavobacterium dankookense]|uniref:Bacteriophage CI repressor-like protein n=1 Tax=Flavobacterium dankookense TaxID=706186 RepID=A0A4R6Q6E4_9FLAO|nr:transcriptional regulator [Flavobacterium dankookense]TDP57811.1 hypothetical protein BC748_2628 [Flavobacterium dankookense]